MSYDAARVQGLVELMLGVRRQEFPHRPLWTVRGAGDVLPPRQRTPLFWGCFDWHSAVHTHWALARWLRVMPGQPWEGAALGALQELNAPAGVEAEVRNLEQDPGFEVPYGMAWLLTLVAELRASGKSAARALAPLEELAANRLLAWVERLRFPVRSGEHSQSAFAMGLGLDWARAVRACASGTDAGGVVRAGVSGAEASPELRAGARPPGADREVRLGASCTDETAAPVAADASPADAGRPHRQDGPSVAVVEAGELEEALLRRSREFYAGDRRAPLAYEPCGHDFLSPALAEADLMRRVLQGQEWLAWLEDFLPDLGPDFAPVDPPDRADGKSAHLDGLNLSRAWMLRNLARALPPSDPRRASWAALAECHARTGLAALASPHFAVTHWLGSYATWWLTRAALPL